MVKKQITAGAKVVRLLKESSEVMGLKLCFRCFDHHLAMQNEWRLHVNPACLVNKDIHTEVCVKAEGVDIIHELAGHPEGFIRECPFGFSELAVAVLVEGSVTGPLFAGTCWLRDEPPPHPDLIIPPSRDWLEIRLGMLRALATEIGRLMQGDNIHRPAKRRTEIMAYIEESLERKVSLEELAAKLNLSPSRTTHLVRELFGVSLPLVARKRKLREAATELVVTDLPIGEISRRYGFEDQNYFSRIFSAEYGISPRAYRNRYIDKV